VNDLEVGLGLETLVNTAARWLAYYHRFEHLVGHRKTSSQIGSQRSAFYRMVWEQAAAEVGASVRHLDGMLEIRQGDAVIRIRGNMTSLDDPVTVAVASDKLLGYGLLSERGLPLPGHCACERDDTATAWRFVSAQSGPCVVKPARGTGAGMGVTTGVSTKARLFRAMVHAGGFATEVLIERQVEGGTYRLLYLDGRLLDAVHRVPPTLRGDGKSTVRELIAAENEDRLRQGTEASQSLLTIDRELRHTLHRSGYNLRSVPPQDDVVQVKTVVNDNRRRDNLRVTDRVCASLVEAGATAAAAVGVRFAGVDVITRDVTVPLGDSGGVIIEVNAMPGLYHHHTTNGGAVPVARDILEWIAQAPGHGGPRASHGNRAVQHAGAQR
jgi:D-alanine-D-alanine ligase-like ATP-grasp enzyme